MAGFFRKIAPDAARFQSLAQRHLRGGEWRAAERVWRWEPAPPPPGCGAVAYATLGAAEISVWLDDWRVPASAALDLPPDAVERLPEPLLRAALAVFAGDGLAALEKATGLPAALTELSRKASAPPAAAGGFRWVRDDGLAVAGAWMAMPRGDGWEAAVRDALSARPAGARPLPDDLPLAGVAALGAWPWPAGALAWEAGDVLLPPGGADVGAARTLTVGRAVRFAAAWTDGILTVEGKTMTTATAPESAPSPGTPPEDAVEVELVAEVGRLTVTLAQLRRLGAGEVVEFSMPVEAPVALTVGGKAIAAGELVDVGGRVGVRIIAAPPGDGR